jgi:hypothetical protein
VRIFAKVVRGPIPWVQKAITLRTAITMSAGIEGPISCVQFVFLGKVAKEKCNEYNLILNKIVILPYFPCLLSWAKF